MYIYMVQHSVLLRRPQTPYNVFFFFFFFFFWKYELIYEFGSEKYAETGNLDLEYFNKNRNGQFWLRNLGATYLCDRLSHRWLGMEGQRQLRVVTGWSHKESRFVPPVLEPCDEVMNQGEGMICAGTDLRLLPAVCTDEMMRSVVVVSCRI